MCKLQLEKNKTKKRKQKRKVQERFYGKTIGEYIQIWNFDNRFLVGVGFKFLKLRCMLHVLLKHLLLLYLKKLIRTNNLLSLSTKT